jgi:hypothetical protein
MRPLEVENPATIATPEDVEPRDVDVRSEAAGAAEERRRRYFMLVQASEGPSAPIDSAVTIRRATRALGRLIAGPHPEVVRARGKR